MTLTGAPPRPTPAATVLRALRSAAYLLVLLVTVAPYSFLTLAWSWVPQQRRDWLVTGWTRLAILAARVICGIGCQVQGMERLAKGWWIVIFPEGTRTAPGAAPRYKTGGSRLAVRTATPVVPIAVNSGELWPRKAFLKLPGTISVSIGAPIDPAGNTADGVAAQVEDWIEGEMHRIAPHRYPAAHVAAAPLPARGTASA